MRNEQAAALRGKKGTSEIKRDYRERDKDESWKEGYRENLKEAARPRAKDGSDKGAKREPGVERSGVASKVEAGSGVERDEPGPRTRA